MTANVITALISFVVLVAISFGVVVVVGSTTTPVHDEPWAHVPQHLTPVDHAAFFSESFEDGPSVTRACLGCHKDAAAEVMATSHWTWAGSEAPDPQTGKIFKIGKRNLQNNFCVSIAANWQRCTSCHVGYGWRDDTFFDTAGPEQVDCLVCHDNSGQYQKEAAGAGHPSEGVDLLAAARSVKRTSRTSCGVCHFKGGGGDGVKHGDLDETMAFPSPRVDVHMGGHGLVCADCHRTKHHQVRGRLLPLERDEARRVLCTDCHSERPHAQDRLNAHVTSLACQTCHVPTYAEETGTKMWWDWSKAGIDGDPHEVAERLVHETLADPQAREALPPPILELFRRVEKDPDVWPHYAKIKGLFLIARRQVPHYAWYDGRTERYLPGQRLPEGVLASINRPLGEAADPRSKIWPFKVHRGRQPYDLKLGHLLDPHVFGKGGYWKDFDWDLALRTGAKASGVPYSGSFGWKTTEMYWPQNHMVRRKEDALQCTDCHGQGGRMPWTALGYSADPSIHGDRRQMDVLKEAGR